jgi:hypothetical protein
LPLIKCPSCDGDVSREARACPKCGHPLKARPVGKIIVLVVLVALLVLVVKLVNSETHRFEKQNAELQRIMESLECTGASRYSPWGIKHCP